jgi:hypothetical protein
MKKISNISCCVKINYVSACHEWCWNGRKRYGNVGDGEGISIPSDFHFQIKAGLLTEVLAVNRSILTIALSWLVVEL